MLFSTSMPRPVDLQPHSPEWAEAAAREIARLTPVFGDDLIAIHHVGSTAIPGILAKPILDLMPVTRDLSLLDACRPSLEALAYVWWGENGIPGRRYCTLSDLATARRKVHVHCFASANREVERHLAFRDYLRARPDVANTYQALKQSCRDRYPLDSRSYTECKQAWITQTVEEAMAFYSALR